MFVFRNLVILLVIAFLANVVRSVPIPKQSNSTLDLIILHNNDMHARFEQTDKYSARCLEADEKKCYGGFARVSQLVKQYRKDADNGGPAVLFLNAGDVYAGSPWFSTFKHKVAADFMNILKPDAMSLGNHELDLGVEGLLPFLNDVNFPVLTANINNTKDHPLWQTKSFKKSVVIDVRGVKIGVIGYLTPETKFLSPKNDVEYMPEIEAINEEATVLKNDGINVLIALGHSGYEVDKKIAKNCPLIDVVIGGHTHSFLFSGGQPENETITGPYPTIVTQSTGKAVPVVQAHAYTKYMGELKLSFDGEGQLIRWNGQVILLNGDIARDPEVLALEDVYRPQVEDIKKSVIGITRVRLDGAIECRLGECNVGNLISDAFVDTRINQYRGPYLTDAPIAVIVGGDIRASGRIGNITQYDLQTILPFENHLISINITGKALREVLEHSVEKYVIKGPRGEFLQVSGLHVTYDLSKPSGERVQKVEALCSACDIPHFEELDANREYGMVLSSYIYEGGDGFSMFKNFKPNYLNITVLDAVTRYIRKTHLIYPAIEGRIKIYGN